MVNYFTASDVSQLDNYANFADKLSTSLLQFRSTLNLGSAVDSRQHALYELDKLINRAKTDSTTWRSTPGALIVLNKEFQSFIDEFVLVSEQVSRSPGTLGSTRLLDLASSRIYQFLRAFNGQRKIAMRLATGTYTVLPRVIDYMHSTIYLYAQRENMLAHGTSIKVGPAGQRISASIRLTPNAASAYRYTQAMKFIEAYQKEYALSYLASSNLTGHLTRLNELSAMCVWQALQLKLLTKPSRLKSSVGILLVSLREIQRMSAETNTLFQRRR